jgi:DNA-binding response OmpR family regulator
MPTPTILLVEDEAHLGRAIKLNLELEGFSVTLAVDGKSALRELLRPEPFGVIVLDVELPDMSGFDLCARLRAAGVFTPVLMLTVRSTPEDRVRGLEAGADDYLTKPFEISELLARLRAQLRRQHWARAAPTSDTPKRRTLAFGRTVIDLDTQHVEVDGAPIALTALELDLVAYFAAHPGRVLSRRELLREVWRLPNHQETRTVDNFVARLRKHFELDPAHPVHFLSHRGRGYRFEPGPA